MKRFSEKVYNFFNYEVILDKHYNYRIISNDDGYMFPITFNTKYHAQKYLDTIIGNLVDRFEIA